jgi:hypothetical protein
LPGRSEIPSFRVRGRLIAESLKLADRMIGDVFELFAPPGAGRKDHPKN